MTHSTRDTYRGRVYTAEALVWNMFDQADQMPGRQVEIFGSRLTLPVERRVVSLASMQTYVDTVLALEVVRSRYDRAQVPVTVRARRGHSRAHYETATATIAMPLHNRSMLRESVLLHELAHHLQPLGSPGHGRQFCVILCHLIELAIGAEAAWLLRATLAETRAYLS
ncbi:TIGR04338 family metallohydrolase [Nocardia gipuzkoensis]